MHVAPQMPPQIPRPGAATGDWGGGLVLLILEDRGVLVYEERALWEGLSQYNDISLHTTITIACFPLGGILRSQNGILHSAPRTKFRLVENRLVGEGQY